MRLFIFIAILLCMDLYVFQGLRVLTSGREPQTQRIVHSIYLFVSVLAIGTLLATGFFDWHAWPRSISTYLFAFIVIVYLSKLFVIFFLLTDDILRIFRWIAMKIMTAGG